MPNKEPTKEWREAFREKFAAKDFDPPFVKHAVYCADVEAFISQSIQDAVLAREAELIEEVKGMYSVYPDGGIHDFGPDEELVSKSQVIALIKE